MFTARNTHYIHIEDYYDYSGKGPTACWPIHCNTTEQPAHTGRIHEQKWTPAVWETYPRLTQIINRWFKPRSTDAVFLFIQLFSRHSNSYCINLPWYLVAKFTELFQSLWLPHLFNTDRNTKCTRAFHVQVCYKLQLTELNSRIIEYQIGRDNKNHLIQPLLAKAQSRQMVQHPVQSVQYRAIHQYTRDIILMLDCSHCKKFSSYI